jgi:hypothetical protein
MDYRLSVLESPLTGKNHGNLRIGLIAGHDGLEIPY